MARVRAGRTARAFVGSGRMILAQKVIVVMGGTSGLGLSAARAFVKAGACVVVVGRKAENLDATLREIGDKADGLAGDATDPETARLAIEVALQQFGGFDGLYHVAGGSGRKFGDGPLHELTDEAIEQTLELNLKSVFYSNRAAIQQFMEQKSGGTILNMASVLGYSPAPRYFSTHVYASAKAAIIGLTRSGASYYASRNIRLNVIAPALVDTPMAQRAVTNDEITRYIRTKQPLDGGRVGVPEDLDAAAVWFMSDESRFVTGQVLAIDGGWTVSEGQYIGPS
jgi:NAD(P)-dependent dehydrogenase (short-subunit alcohol dehydrogenase family)